MTSLSSTTEFNHGLQFELLFLDDGIVVHLVCMCIMWVEGAFTKSREPVEILPIITHIWFRVYGPPKFIGSDQEGALFSDQGRQVEGRAQVQTSRRPCVCD